MKNPWSARLERVAVAARIRPSVLFLILVVGAALWVPFAAWGSSHRGPSRNTKTASTTTLTATPNPLTVGQTAVLKATVTGAAGAPTGTVSFLFAGSAIGSAPLASGTASFSASTDGLPPGSYTITASYAGNANYAASTSANYVVKLNKASTTTTVTASPNPVTSPADCVLTATVKRPAGSAGAPTGTVKFYVGTVNFGSATLNASGVAKLSASTGTVSPGTYPVTADYQGDSSDSASTSSSVSVTVNAAPGAYAYTLNSDLNTQELGNVSAYGETTGNGKLALLANSPFQAGLDTPLSLAVDNPMKLLFVAGTGGGSETYGEIVAFAINNSTGNLGTPVVTVAADSAHEPFAIAVGPQGKYLFVSTTNSSIAVYTVAANGALAEISGSPFALPSANCGLFCEASSNQLTYDAVNHNVYLISAGGSVVATFTVDTSTGSLTWVYNEPVAGGPNDVAVTPSGAYVYTTSTVGNAGVSAYAVTPGAMSGGEPEPLTQISGSPFAAGETPNGLAIEPTGTYLYVTNNGDDTISAFTINSTSGALMAVQGSPFAITGGGSSPTQIVVDPTGHYLYVSCQSYNGGSLGAVTAYSITSGTGAIKQLSGSPYSLGTNASSALQIGVYKPQ